MHPFNASSLLLHEYCSINTASSLRPLHFVVPGSLLVARRGCLLAIAASSVCTGHEALRLTGWELRVGCRVHCAVTLRSWRLLSLRGVLRLALLNVVVRDCAALGPLGVFLC